LSVRLPDDFTHMCEYYKDAAVETPAAVSFSAEPGSDSVVTLTQALRSEMGLPERYAVLEVTENHVLLLREQARALGCPSGGGFGVPRCP